MYVHKYLQQEVGWNHVVITKEITDEYQSWYSSAAEDFLMMFLLILGVPLLLIFIPFMNLYRFAATMKFHLLGGAHPGKVIHSSSKTLQLQDDE